jgi:hypothetical protein
MTQFGRLSGYQARKVIEELVAKPAQSAGFFYFTGDVDKILTELSGDYYA